VFPSTVLGQSASKSDDSRPEIEEPLSNVVTFHMVIFVETRVCFVSVVFSEIIPSRIDKLLRN